MWLIKREDAPKMGHRTSPRIAIGFTCCGVTWMTNPMPFWSLLSEYRIRSRARWALRILSCGFWLSSIGWEAVVEHEWHFLEFSTGHWNIPTSFSSSFHSWKLEAALFFREPGRRLRIMENRTESAKWWTGKGRESVIKKKVKLFLLKWWGSLYEKSWVSPFKWNTTATFWSTSTNNFFLPCLYWRLFFPKETHKWGLKNFVSDH